MYVCVCNAVTERDIDGAIASGCDSLRQLREALGVGACCGRCATCAREKLKDAQAPCPPFDHPAAIRGSLKKREPT